MTNNKHQAVWDWLQTCPHIKDLFFNFSQSEPEDTELVPAESVVEEYLDGSKLCRYHCALTRVLRCSFEPNDLSNIQAVVEFEKINQWLETQNDLGNFPAFPAGEYPLEITVYPNESGFAAAQDLELCKYTLQFQIEYLKEKKG